MRKEIGANPGICKKLQFQPVKGVKRLQFLLLEYHFFKDSEGGSALPLSLPWILFPLSLMLHIVKSHALTLLRLHCFFVRLQKRTVGLLAIQEYDKGLIVASLGVAKGCRRLGIGTCMLGYIEATAKRMGKRWLEVDVLRKNIPAQRLYAKCGFMFIQSERIRFLLRGKKPL